MNIKGKKILVLGLSKSGIAAAKLAKKHGAEVFLSEGKDVEKPQLDFDIEVGGHSDNFIEGSDLVITSPGIPPHSDILTRIKEKNIPIISEIEFAYRMSKTPFIVITGTNGKTTTTSLTQHILSKKLKTEACGNIGLPPSDIADNNLDYFVCEASSFQLETSPTLKPFIAVWTNFTPDHIDWHSGLENYFKAKAKIFKGEQTAQYCVLNAKDKKLLDFSKNIIGGKLFLFDGNIGDNCCYLETDRIFFKQNGIKEEIISLSQCPLIGQHNYQNIMCAVICAKLTGIDNNTIKTAIMEFKAPAHRLEKIITDARGITYFNDSKATNPEASIVAINSFNKEHVVLIAGGRDKNTDLEEFCCCVKQHINEVILIGEAAERFEENLKNSGFKNIYRENSLESAIDKGIEIHPDVILLSPACASFDMFSGYEERGEVFRKYVLSRK